MRLDLTPSMFNLEVTERFRELVAEWFRGIEIDVANVINCSYIPEAKIMFAEVAYLAGATLVAVKNRKGETVPLSYLYMIDVKEPLCDEALFEWQRVAIARQGHQGA